MLWLALKVAVYAATLYLAINGNHLCEIVATTYFLFALLCVIIALNSTTVQKHLRNSWFHNTSPIKICFELILDAAIVVILFLSSWHFFSIIYCISFILYLYLIIILALRG